MRTAEFIEQVLDVKLLDFQKDYLDYLDRHPDARVVLPRGRTVTCTYDLWILSQLYLKWFDINFFTEEENKVYEREQYEKLKAKYGE